MHFDLGDVDGHGDGDLDTIPGHRQRSNRLDLNDGQGFFSLAEDWLLPSRQDSTLSVALGDVIDGDWDVFFTNERDQNRLYLNDGNGHFFEATHTRMPPDLALVDQTVHVQALIVN